MSTNPKDITIVNQVAGPMCIDIANAFVEKKSKVVLLTGTLEPTYSSLDEKVKTVKGIKYRRNRAVSRILTWLLFFIQAFVSLLFSNKSKKLLLVSNPPIAPFLGLIMNKLFKQEYDILIYDIYPDILAELGFLSRKSSLFRFWQSLNKKAFNRANRIITLSPSMKEVLGQYVNQTKIEIIPCWVDSSKIKPIVPKETNPFAKKYNQENKCTVLYSGNMGASHDIESVVFAAKELKEEKGIHFLLIGNGVKKQKIENLISVNNLTNITVLPFQDSDIVPYSMACGDISIVTTEKNAGSFLIPSKSFYYIAAGSKIISLSKNNSDLDQLISKHKLGINITHEESRSKFAEAIKSLSLEISKEDKKRISTVAQSYNSDHAKSF